MQSTILFRHEVEHIHISTDLVILGGTGVERPAQKQLGNDAAQGPHVNGLTERQTQNNLWRPGWKKKRKHFKHGLRMSVCEYHRRPSLFPLV